VIQIGREALAGAGSSGEQDIGLELGHVAGRGQNLAHDRRTPDISESGPLLEFPPHQLLQKALVPGLAGQQLMTQAVQFRNVPDRW
jgi:hypothetical protein